ncbi:hypothetical protein [Nocardia vermiculata]|uniref:Uncharacterized protein n=2 Tax=Nocardia vermiculata TaxID=257274 RepID=A0A846YBL8_9NOCA|nr:hypothetical protein [Nocardia vermiculata]NKY54179.1 hypothetical protein [Nocardia vermiculata]
MLPGLLEALDSGSAQPGGTDPVSAAIADTPSDPATGATGSAELAPALLQALTSGSASGGAGGQTPE